MKIESLTNQYIKKYTTNQFGFMGKKWIDDLLLINILEFQIDIMANIGFNIDNGILILELKKLAQKHNLIYNETQNETEK